MGDTKTSYTTTVSKVKKISESNKSLAKKLSGGKRRADQYKNSWQNVNINNLVTSIAPGATSYESGGKIIFSNGGRYIIVTDVAGGYARIKDLQNHGKNPYVTLNLKPFNTLSPKDRQRLTHFRILKREEM